MLVYFEIKRKMKTVVTIVSLNKRTKETHVLCMGRDDVCQGRMKFCFVQKFYEDNSKNFALLEHISAIQCVN